MFISCVCITWNRPRLLGQLVECFLRQTHKDCELVILDDAGQYPDQPHGDRWRIVSEAKRYPSIAAKRNAASRLIATDSQGILHFDDDDIYLPWAVAATAAALDKHQWACPSQALEWAGPNEFVKAPQLCLSRHYTYKDGAPPDAFRAYGGQWSWRVEAFDAVGGFHRHGLSEDSALSTTLRQKFGPPGDTICPEFPLPFYIYSRAQSGDQHISEMGQGQSGYETIGRQPLRTSEEFAIGWPMDYAAIPIPDTVHPRPW